MFASIPLSNHKLLKGGDSCVSKYTTFATTVVYGQGKSVETKFNFQLRGRKVIMSAPPLFIPTVPIVGGGRCHI